ncbi:MAG: hypothetical protein A3H28_01455 [Acidobacteria bacterium RIFCSPLOWO2_02_FULL_61_28]|nr:MAG: hypothetical protein A3H28_01455 [Acidobacteria bacterium RIFCSPLOWO2_02_FULL_61_28]
MEHENVQPASEVTEPGFPRSASPAVRSRRYGGRARRALGVLASAVLIAMASVAFLIGLSWVRSQGAVNAVQAQVQAIRDGKVEEAYTLFSRSYQEGMSLPMFRRWLRRQKRLANVQHLQFWGRSAWRGTALLWGSFEDNLGHSYPVRYLLVQEGGAWRIDRFQLSAELPDPAPQNERLIGI